MASYHDFKKMMEKWLILGHHYKTYVLYKKIRLQFLIGIFFLQKDKVANIGNLDLNRNLLTHKTTWS